MQNICAKADIVQRPGWHHNRGETFPAEIDLGELGIGGFNYQGSTKRPTLRQRQLIHCLRSEFWGGKRDAEKVH